MDTKTCPRPTCEFHGQPQPLDNFCRDKHTKDGRGAYCRSCRATLAKERAKLPEVRAQLNARQYHYQQRSDVKARRRDRYTTREYREKANAYQREYRKRPEVKLYQAMKAATYRTRNRLKEAARHAVRYALRSGKLLKPAYCGWCGEAGGQLEAHHWRGYDPAHWLDVKFVHAACHDACEDKLPEHWPWSSD